MTAAASDPETRSWDLPRRQLTRADVVISVFQAQPGRPAALTQAHLAYCSPVGLEIISVESEKKNKLVLMVCMCVYACVCVFRHVWVDGVHCAIQTGSA